MKVFIITACILVTTKVCLADGNIGDVGKKRRFNKNIEILVDCLAGLKDHPVLRPFYQQLDKGLGAYKRGDDMSQIPIDFNKSEINGATYKSFDACMGRVDAEDFGAENANVGGKNATFTAGSFDSFQNLEKTLECMRASQDYPKANKALLDTEHAITAYINGTTNTFGPMSKAIQNLGHVYNQNDEFNDCFEGLANAQAKGKEEGSIKGEAKDSAESEAEVSTADDSKVSAEGEDEVSTEGKADGSFEEDDGKKKRFYKNTEKFIGCLAAFKDDLGVKSLLQLLDIVSGAYINGLNMSNIMIPIDFDSGMTEERDFKLCIGMVDPEDDGDKNATFIAGNFDSFQNLKKVIDCARTFFYYAEPAFLQTEYEVTAFINGDTKTVVPILGSFETVGKELLKYPEYNRCLGRMAEVQGKGTEEGSIKGEAAGEVEDGAESEAEYETEGDPKDEAEDENETEADDSTEDSQVSTEWEAEGEDEVHTKGKAEGGDKESPEGEVEGSTEVEAEDSAECESEVEDEVRTKGEAEITPKGENEGSTEVEAEGSAESEDEVSTKGKDEGSTEVKAEGTDESEDEVSTEGKGEGSADSGAEGEGEVTEEKAEGTGESEAEGENEANTEAEAEDESSPKGEDEGSAVSETEGSADNDSEVSTEGVPKGEGQGWVDWFLDLFSF